MTRIRSQRGLMARIATELMITRAAVARWSRVPAGRVWQVEAITGIPAADLRPDLSGKPIPGVPAEEASI